jgi:hypothetical protein
MTVVGAVNILDYADPVLSLIGAVALLRARAAKEYASLLAILSIRSTVAVVGWALEYHAALFGLSTKVAYVSWFYFYWSFFAVQSILMLVMIFSMYRLAMAPLKGLHNLGMIVFKWVATISIFVALGSAFAPHTTKLRYLISFVSQMQRTQSILILCLLLFVCFAIRPMGLTYRSRIFGISLGLGIMATTNMVQASWLGHVGSMYGWYSLISGSAICFSLITWTTYFVVPEPSRRLITLPTTSPFLRWNQISEVLGDNPGHVAIGGLPPEMLAPAEIEVMRRASLKMQIPWSTLPESVKAI